MNQTYLKNIFRHGTNVVLAALFVWFAYENLAAFVRGAGISSLLLTIAEAILVYLFIFRDPAKMTSRNPADWVAAFIGSAAPSFLRPDHFPDPLQASILAIIGSILLVASYLSLNKSLGIVPSLRDIKTKGMYHWVRHPIYASYLFLDIGYFIGNPTMLNFILVGVIIITIVIRISREEKILLNDDSYREYREKTPWKMIPFLY